MLKPKPYYYEDIVFQLELNLQSIRRELVKLLDDCGRECLSCSRLRCRCQPLSSAASSLSDDSGLFGVRSPPPYTLPHPRLWKPDFLTTIDSWIKASTDLSFKQTRRFPLSNKVLSNFSLTWPPFAKSVWNDRAVRDAVERESTRSHRSVRENSVDEFFGYFSKKMANKCGYF